MKPKATRYAGPPQALLALALGLGGQAASAAEIGLVEWALNLNTDVYGTFFDPAPPAVDSSGFDFATGLGTLSVRLSGIGGQFVGWFLDHEIDQSLNGWTNETGAVSGAPQPGQTWEIDEPGYGMNGSKGPYVGDVMFFNFLDSDASGSLLDNLVLESYGRCNPANAGDPTVCDEPGDYFDDTQRLPLSDFKASNQDDVSVALGWEFLLDLDQFAHVSVTVSEDAPASGFHLIQTDADTGSQIYIFSELRVFAVPLPATPLLLIGGLLGLGIVHRSRWHHSANACSPPAH